MCIRSPWSMVSMRLPLGYIRIALGSNTCAIATDPTYSKVSKALDPTSYNFEPV